MSDQDPGSQGPKIPMDDPRRDTVPAQAFMMARATSIQAYATVEQSLATLFGILLKTDFELSGIVFFRIINTHSRNAIIENLMKTRYGSTYNLYWNSMTKLIRGLDGKRNEIVHWQTAKNLNINADGSSTSTFTLVPPNFWSRHADSPSISTDQLHEFTHKCDFVGRSLGMFILLLLGKLSGDKEQTWREIFQQPTLYPPLDNHSLYLND